MEDLKTFDKNVLQNRINEYFDSFRDVDLNGRTFRLMPTKNDVPLIKEIFYNPHQDTFNIIFESRDVVNTKMQHSIEFLEDSNGKLIGIRINDLKKNDVNTIKLEIISTLDDVIKGASVNLGKNPSLKALAEINIEQRKVDFFKDFMENDFNKLVDV